jgi:hypothetical protein
MRVSRAPCFTAKQMGHRYIGRRPLARPMQSRVSGDQRRHSSVRHQRKRGHLTSWLGARGMDNQSSHGLGMDLSKKMAASPSYGTAVETYRKAVSTAAAVTAYAVLARCMARELLPDELRDTARWAASLLMLAWRRPGCAPPQRRTVVIRPCDEEDRENGF